MFRPTHPDLKVFATYDEYKDAQLEWEEYKKTHHSEDDIIHIHNSEVKAKEKAKRIREYNLRRDKEERLIMENKKFANGLRVEEKIISDDFKIIKLGIKAEEFMEFLAKYTNAKGYVNIDIKRSKSGKLYPELNTYGLDKKEEENEEILKFGDEEVPF